MTEAAPVVMTVEIEARIIRADGTVEELGVVATSDPDGPGSVSMEQAIPEGAPIAYPSMREQ